MDKEKILSQNKKENLYLDEYEKGRIAYIKI